LTTVHDLSYLVCPHLQTQSNSRSLRRGIEFSERRSAHYLAVSESTRRDLIKSLKIDPNRIETVPNSVSRRWFCPVINPADIQSVRDRYGLPEGLFLLSVSTIEPRKNLRNLVAAFEEFREKHPTIEAHLILAGAVGWEDIRELKKRITRCPTVRYIGYVEEEDLPTLYSAAAALCYVSTYEGFGLPILEAMACATPSIYGNNSSMPEIAGESGLPADVQDTSDIARCMARILLDEDLRFHLSLKAVRLTLRVGWASAAEHTLRCYRNAIENSPILPEREGRTSLE